MPSKAQNHSRTLSSIDLSRDIYPFHGKKENLSSVKSTKVLNICWVSQKPYKLQNGGWKMMDDF